MTHTTHEQSRQRNEKFAEFIKSEEVQQQMKTISKSKCLGFLREQFKEKYNISIPASAAYRVIASKKNTIYQYRLQQLIELLHLLMIDSNQNRESGHQKLHGQLNVMKQVMKNLLMK